MKKIIHMSDLHVGYRNFNERFQTISDNVINRISDKLANYVIIITGDLVNNANKKGSYEEVTKTLDKLKESGFKYILVVPGNHDYGSGKKGNKKFVKLFKLAFYKSEIDYPILNIIDSVAFIGLDSMAQELHWYDNLWAQGELGEDQLGKLESILKSSDVRECKKRVIYLHHHPFRWKPLHELKDSLKLKKVIRRLIDSGISIDALLFGHNHQGNSHNGHWGIPRCYDAGTATLKSRPKFINWAPLFRVKSATRIIDLEKSLHFEHKINLLKPI